MNNIIELIKNNIESIKNIQFDKRSEAMTKLSDILQANKCEVRINVNKGKEIFLNNYFIDIDTKTMKGIKKIVKIRISNGKGYPDNEMAILSFNKEGYLEVHIL